MPKLIQAMLLTSMILASTSVLANTDDNPAMKIVPAGLPSHDTGARKGAAGKDETLLLEVTVNGQALPDVVRVERLADGRLVLPLDAWKAARLRPSGEKLALPDARFGYALDAVSGIRFNLDRARMRLEVTAPPAAFDEETRAVDDYSMILPSASPPGMYVNYDILRTQSGDGSDSYSALLEGIAFNGWGSLVSGGILRGNDGENASVRTETYWRKDLPGSREAFVVGDTIGSSGTWSRPVRYGGVRFARDFSLAPGFISYPTPSLQGSAALPSTVDILVNNQRQTSGQNVDTGPFSLTNVPVITGAGEVNMVVRDLRGVETVITQSFYVSPRLLRGGLSDYSIETGAFRQNYGIDSNDYGPAFMSGTYRYGISNALTAAGRVELQRARKAAGVDLSGLLGMQAVALGSAAWSQSDTDSEGKSSGGRYLALLERNSQFTGVSMQWEYFDSGFRQFGYVTDETRPKKRIQASASMRPVPGRSVALSYIQQTAWNDDPYTLTALTLGEKLPGNVYLNLYVSKQKDPGGGFGFGMYLIMPMERMRTASASTTRSNDGNVVNLLQASQTAPTGPGWGWRVQASDDPAQRAQAGVILNTNHGQMTAEANEGRNANAVRVGLNGSVGWLEGMSFASRRIDHGSFAVVKVADFKDVPIYLSNQIAATTGSDGKALVTGLLPYQKNKLTLDPVELPLETDIRRVRETVVPYARSGQIVEFAVRRSRNALVILRQPDGEPVPSGAVVTVIPGNHPFTVARRGEVYLTDLQADNRLTVTWPGGGCALPLPLDPKGPSEPRIGPLVCQKQK